MTRAEREAAARTATLLRYGQRELAEQTTGSDATRKEATMTEDKRKDLVKQFAVNYVKHDACFDTVLRDQAWRNLMEVATNGAEAVRAVERARCIID